MELKVTTERALDFEARTGKDMLNVLHNIEKTNEVKIREIVDLFIACGENYTVAMFDAWDKPFMSKVQDIMNAVGKYFGTQKKSAGSKAKK